MTTETTFTIFENLKLDCQYFDEYTEGCHMWGSPNCEKCSNFFPKQK